MLGVSTPVVTVYADSGTKVGLQSYDDSKNWLDTLESDRKATTEAENNKIDNSIVEKDRKAGWNQFANNWYYFDKQKNTFIKNEWKLINGKWYFFNPNGSMVIGNLIDQDHFYVLNNDGSMYTGWKKLSSDNAGHWIWIYFFPNGSLYEDSGTLNIDGINYNFNNGEWREPNFDIAKYYNIETENDILTNK